MTKGGGGQKSQKINDVFYERPLNVYDTTSAYVVNLSTQGGGDQKILQILSM